MIAPGTKLLQRLSESSPASATALPATKSPMWRVVEVVGSSQVSPKHKVHECARQSVHGARSTHTGNQTRTKYLLWRLAEITSRSS